MGRKSSELSIGCKENIITFVQKGISYGEIGRMLDIPKSTVFSVWKKFSTQGDVENSHRSGRRKSIDVRSARKLTRQVRGDRKLVLSDVTLKFSENNNVRVSEKTIWRCLRQNGYKRCVCKKRIRVRSENRVKRVRWCMEKRTWSVNSEWKKVIFLMKAK